MLKTAGDDYAAATCTEYEVTATADTCTKDCANDYYNHYIVNGICTQRTTCGYEAAKSATCPPHWVPREVIDGWYTIDDTCVACVEGTWAAGDGDCATHTACGTQAGGATRTTTAGTATADAVCAACSVGSFGAATGACTACTAVDNAATVTCTSATDSAVATCAAGYTKKAGKSRFLAAHMASCVKDAAAAGTPSAAVDAATSSTVASFVVMVAVVVASLMH
jgi:hypothetical protein